MEHCLQSLGGNICPGYKLRPDSNLCLCSCPAVQLSFCPCSCPSVLAAVRQSRLQLFWCSFSCFAQARQAFFSPLVLNPTHPPDLAGSSATVPRLLSAQEPISCLLMLASCWDSFPLGNCHAYSLTETTGNYYRVYTVSSVLGYKLFAKRERVLLTLPSSWST